MRAVKLVGNVKFILAMFSVHLKEYTISTRPLLCINNPVETSVLNILSFH